MDSREDSFTFQLTVAIKNAPALSTKAANLDIDNQKNPLSQY